MFLVVKQITIKLFDQSFKFFLSHAILVTLLILWAEKGDHNSLIKWQFIAGKNLLLVSI